MEQDLRSIGYGCAGIRTLICAMVMIFPLIWINSSWDGSLNSIIFGMIIALILSIIIVYSWVCALRGGPFRAIQKFCSQSDNPEAMAARLEKIWSDNVVTEGCRINDEYFILARKLRSIVIPLKDIEGIQCDPLMTSPSFGLGVLCIYLKDGTLKKLSILETDGFAIEEHILQNCEGIVVGKLACREKRALLERNVGRINTRYRIIKLGNPERYFIVDFANPRKLRNYAPFSLIFASKSKVKSSSLSAWEITRKDLYEIKYKPYESSNFTHAIGASLGLALSQIGRFFFLDDEISREMLLAISFGLFLILLFGVNLSPLISPFRAGRYRSIQIVEKERQRHNHDKWTAITMLCLFTIMLGIFVFAIALGSMNAVIMSFTVFIMFYLIFEKFFFKHPKIELSDIIIPQMESEKRVYYVKLRYLRKTKKYRTIINHGE